MKIKSLVTVAILLSISLNAQAADPLSALGALDNALRATSIVDIVSKAVASGADVSKITTVPRLKVVSDCGECKLSNATRMLMTSAYVDLAKQNNVTINQDEQVIFKITSIAGRNSFLRGTLGVLSGADYIRGHFENEEKIIGEYSVSHEMGLDEITQSLGEDVLKEIIKKNVNTNNSKTVETHN
jgi:hypothetical protein